MKSGTVKLIDAKEQLIFEEKYKSQQHRQSIINGWEDLYGARFRFMFIQIVPDLNPQFTHNFKRGATAKTYSLRKPANRAFPAHN